MANTIVNIIWVICGALLLFISEWQQWVSGDARDPPSLMGHHPENKDWCWFWGGSLTDSNRNRWRNFAFSFSAVLCSMTAVSIRSPCPRNSGEFIPGSSRKNVGVGAGDTGGAAAGAVDTAARGGESTVESPLVASVMVGCLGFSGAVAAAAGGCDSALIAGSDDDVWSGPSSEPAATPTPLPPPGLCIGYGFVGRRAGGNVGGMSGVAAAAVGHCFRLTAVLGGFGLFLTARCCGLVLGCCRGGCWACRGLPITFRVAAAPEVDGACPIGALAVCVGVPTPTRPGGGPKGLCC